MRRHPMLLAVFTVALASCTAGSGSLDAPERDTQGTKVPPATAPEAATIPGAVDTTAPTGATTGEPERSGDETTTAPPASVGGDGVAWLGGFGSGVTALGADGWHPFRTEFGNLRSDQIHDIALAPDGSAWIAHSSGLIRADRHGWVDLDVRGFDAIAVDPVTGDVWGVRYRTAARYDGTSWTEHQSTEFGQGRFVDLVNDVAVDPQGRAWVATTSSVAMFDGVAWTSWEEGRGIPEFPYGTSIAAIDAAPDGRIWVSHSNGVLVYDGSTWVNTDPGISQPGNVTAAPDGRIFVASHSDGLAVNEDGRWSVITRSQGGLTTDRVRDAAVDRRGRLWVGTTWGFSVYDGATWTGYTMATGGLAGNLVEAIAVAGDGPELPAPGAPRLGSLQGTILAAGEPLAGTTVLLCSESPAMLFFGEHPCSAYPFSTATQTDASGVYRFEAVPVGDYEIAWKDSTGVWRAFLIGGVEPQVREGVTTSVPPVDEDD